jgi:protein TonB
MPSPQEAMTLFVNFIAPPAPEKKPEPPQAQPKKPRPVTPPPARLVAATPTVAPTDYVAPPPPKPIAVIEAPAPPPPVAQPAAPQPAGPISLGSELAVTCPERTPPSYPALRGDWAKKASSCCASNSTSKAR